MAFSDNSNGKQETQLLRRYNILCQDLQGSILCNCCNITTPSPSCRSIRKYFLDKFSQSFDASQYSTLTLQESAIC